jgi:phytoene dehydrogenase-like protein
VDEWDYIVVGGGHNGLSAACTLAAAGAKVVVLERQPIVGGLSTSHNYLAEAPDHILSVGAMDDMFMSATSLVDDLGLRSHGHVVRPLQNPYGWVGEDGETLLLSRDYQRTLADVRRFSAQDARTYAELRPALDWLIDTQQLLMTSHPAHPPKKALVRQLLKLAPNRRIRRTVGRLISCTLVEAMAETFESDQMRSLCTYWGSMIGPIDSGGGGVYCVGLAAVHRDPGAVRPIGGMGSVMRAFAAHLSAHGGEIRTEVTVERILVNATGAYGVRIADGTELRARRGVLAAIPPQAAFGPLLEDGVLDVPTRAKVAMLPASGNNSATFKIDLAVAGRVGFPKAEAARARRDDADVRTASLMTGTFAEQIEQILRIRRGETLERPPVYMAILSANDPSLAPAGQDVVYLASNVPARPVDGWEKCKPHYSGLVLASVSRFMSGLEPELGRIETSPADFEAQWATPNGSYFHVDMTLMRLGMNRPARGLGGYTTPVPRYYLAGAGAHPGGGVSGWPGRLAAQTALAASCWTG